ncbi:MAG TPA: phosphopyruvate hydratase [Hypericibacter adhaerens]|jgi:enolase|uniref:Enolase n=1 Tax=Hypericibacter adhaerens TaxID=2602016 RepID=A0A5J6MZN5_9PROT|nr:phosphopyruvate hydratase [Hypericibacter adhaerens]QEX23019.1 enolase [Hypericibacter adhaerens]HWA44249.1 phosphopyruvate hydratase [Hypericibacter adhaerens]
MAETTIVGIKARQILDSRGRPTVEADIELAGGATGRASVPSGASTSRAEAHELRDADANRYFGRGVSRAVGHVRGEIASALLGQDAADQSGLDRRMRELDGTPQLERLGANAVLSVSLAACRATAAARQQPLYRRIAELTGTRTPMLPLPMVNIFSGGLHAGRGMDLQDFLAIPLAATDYESGLHAIVKVRDAAEGVVHRHGAPVLLADEGGLSPGCASAEIALELMVEAIERAGLKPGLDIGIAIDVAATALVGPDGRYHLAREGHDYSSAQMIETVERWVRRFPIVSVEDGLHDEDWSHWPELTARLRHIQVVGDDLFSTNPARIRRGIDIGAANSALIKVNQNGTLSGTLEAIATSRQAGYATVISARSGETADSFIADLAVGALGGQIKIGSVRNMERLEKYNQLLRIAEDPEVGYAGTRFLACDARPAAAARIA